MRAFLRRMILLVGLVALGTAACRSSTGPSAGDLEITARPSHTRLPAGEPLVVEVHIANASSHTVRIPGRFPSFLEVRNAAREIVAFGRFQTITLVAPAPRPLAPGELLVDRAPWAGELTGSDEVAVPGIYRLRAAVPLVDGTGYAYSESVAVELTAPTDQP